MPCEARSTTRARLADLTEPTAATGHQEERTAATGLSPILPTVLKDVMAALVLLVVILFMVGASWELIQHQERGTARDVADDIHLRREHDAMTISSTAGRRMFIRHAITGTAVRKDPLEILVHTVNDPPFTVTSGTIETAAAIRECIAPPIDPMPRG